MSDVQRLRGEGRWEEALELELFGAATFVSLIEAKLSELG